MLNLTGCLAGKRLRRLELVLYANELIDADALLLVDALRPLQALDSLVLNVARWAKQQ